MPNIDDLIQTIHTNEAPDLPGDFPADLQNRLEKRILASISNESALGTATLKRIPLRKRFILPLSAIFVLLLGITSFAAVENEWDIVLANFMGLNDPSTLQLDSGEVQIHTSAESNGLKITSISSIGDKNSAYIRMDTNYELPEDFDETTDYILPEDFTLNISNKKEGTTKQHGATLACFYENNKLGFLLEISDCDTLNKSYVSITFENLILYHGRNSIDENAAGEELLHTGQWHLRWKYSYKATTKTVRSFEKIHILDNDIWITQVDISPISIRIEGKRSPLDFDKPWGDSAGLMAIHFKNGTVIDNLSESACGRSNTTFNYYVNLAGLGSVIDPNEINFLVLGNQKIYL